MPDTGCPLIKSGDSCADSFFRIQKSKKIKKPLVFERFQPKTLKTLRLFNDFEPGLPTNQTKPSKTLGFSRVFCDFQTSPPHHAPFPVQQRCEVNLCVGCGHEAVLFKLWERQKGKLCIRENEKGRERERQRERKRDREWERDKHTSERFLSNLKERGCTFDAKRQRDQEGRFA